MKKLENKVSIVTGAGAGMGKAITLLFAAEGSKVVAVDINPEGLDALKKEIKAHGGEVTTLLADMAIEIEAARSLIYSVARFIDSGAKDVSKESAMAKTYATDVGMRVTTNALQIMGGSGYMKEYPVEKMMRDAKILQIYEGTNQIQRNVIGQAIIREAAKIK